LRLLRVQRAMRHIVERIRSDAVKICVDIAKIVLIILGFTHLCACAWYGIGNQEADETWVAKHFVQETSLSERYVLSVHWSVSQLTGGMEEVVPCNLSERVFSVLALLLGFLLTAVLVSSLTSEITRLQIASNQNSLQFSVLRRFLADHCVSTRLAVRIQRNARRTLKWQQRNMNEAGVELLRLVSEPLRRELHFEIYSPILAGHPFFSLYIEDFPHVMRKVCHRSASMHLVSAGDVVFSAGEMPNPPKMYFVTSGILEYFTTHGRRDTIHGSNGHASESTWLAEAALWTRWTHRGGLKARSDTRLCEVDAQSFQHIVGEFDHVAWDPRLYATRFVGLINELGPCISDLPVPTTALEEVLGTLRRSPRMSSRLSLSSKKSLASLLPIYEEGADD